MTSRHLSCLLLLSLPLLFPEAAAAQYFGRNKVVYESYRFEVLQTEHFDIHYYPSKYPEGAPAIRDAARMSERWYTRLSGLFEHKFTERKPVIFYENQTDFHQTNIIGSEVGEGTGGITEGLKNRLFMPLAGSYGATDHVLGHEMVHVFQYDLAQNIGGTKSKGFGAMGSLPLWFIEGMAEYLSIGPVDTQTAMWLRSAAMQDRLPTIQDLTRQPGNYFPYRWGHAFWSFVAGTWGDTAVTDLYRAALRQGLEAAITSVLEETSASLSKRWQDEVRAHFQPLLETRNRPRQAGNLVIPPAGGPGGMNMAPSLSPDGRHIAYISERDLFSLEIFLADAQTGETMKKLTSTSTSRHFSALRFLDSAGAWSPDGNKLAFVVFARGRNELAVLNVNTRRIERRYRVDKVEEILNPSWSPDGSRIVFSGLSGGQSDLYLLDLDSGSTRQLTDDRHADLQPTWSPGGSAIAFTTDRGQDTDFSTLRYGPTQIALYQMQHQRIQTLPLFSSARHINPQFGQKAGTLYFIGDPDGFSDIYRVDLRSGDLYRITRLGTGVTGITELSPAMSVARNSGDMVFSIFGSGSYGIFTREARSLSGQPVAEEQLQEAQGGHLPPIARKSPQVVSKYLETPERGLVATSTFRSQTYRPSLQFDYVSGGGGLGIGSGGFNGPQLGLSGGLYTSFSDLLGDHQVGATVLANGGYKDLGGQLYYMNRKRRLMWGAVAGHTPNLTSRTIFGRAPLPGSEDPTPVPYVGQIEERQYIQNAGFITAYPLSPNRRIEAALAYARYTAERNFTQYFGRRQETRQALPPPDPLHLGEVSASFVGDRSFSGFTAPIRGARYRFEVTPTFGSVDYLSTTADYRRYFFSSPFTLGIRGLFAGQFGADSERSFGLPYFIGYGGMVRGYGPRSFEPEECPPATRECPVFDRLSGSRAAVMNIELRTPLLGTDAYGLINFPYLPTDVSLFVDGGTSWTRSHAPTLKIATRSDERTPVFSTGLSARMNILGYIILESYYAYPFQRPDKGAHWGFVLSPGW